MSGLFKAFKTSEVKEEQGVPVTIDDAANTDGSIPTFFVRYFGSKSNVKHRAAIDAAYKPFKRQVEAENRVAIEKWQQKSNDLFCDHIITGWENVLDENDQPLEYSKEACRDLMQAMPVLLTRISEVAFDYEKFRAEDLEADAKN